MFMVNAVSKLTFHLLANLLRRLEPVLQKVRCSFGMSDSPVLQPLTRANNLPSVQQRAFDLCITRGCGSSTM